MKTLERRKAIVALLLAEGTMSVTALARRFHLSEVTIRRDLVALGNAGRIIRVHGGASPATPIGYEPSWESRARSATAEKRNIARLAATLVEQEMVIALDSGTTLHTVVQYLEPVLPLTIVTGSIAIAQSFSKVPQEQANVILPGGSLRNASQLIVGGESSLRDYHCDIAIMSCTGFSFSKGAMHTNLFASELKRTLVEISDTVVLVADYSKFLRASLATFATLDQIDIIITDWRTPESTILELEKVGKRVMVADPEFSEAEIGQA